MNKKLNLETRVGLFFVVVFCLIVWISFKLGNYEFGESGGYQLSAVFPSASGLDPESAVLMAGIRIGKIEKIELYDGQAKVIMRIRDDAVLPEDSSISIRARGLLGAKFLEITPGKSDLPFKDGQRIYDATGAGEINAVMGELQEIATDIKSITGNLREIFGTPEGEQGMVEIFENLQRMTTVMGDSMEANQENFNKLVANLENFTRNLAYLSAKNREDLSRAMAAFPAIAENMKIISQNLAQVMNANNQEINETLKNLAAATERLQEAMTSVASITQKVDEGEGTIGKLVNDDETVDNLNEAVTGINEFLTRVQTLQAEIAYKAEYNPVDNDAKSIFNLKLQPRKDKYYMLGIVDDPSGRTRVTDTVTETTTNPGAAGERTVSEVEHKEVTSDQLLLNAQMAKRWHDFVVRGGIIESKGGVGMEYLLWDDQINFAFEAYDFASESNPALKAGVDFTLFRHFIITGGVDDFINKYDDPRFFFGGGIKITDDDISVLFSRMPLPDM